MVLGNQGASYCGGPTWNGMKSAKAPRVPLANTPTLAPTERLTVAVTT